MTKAVTLLFKQFKDRFWRSGFGDYPKLAQFDDGLEFYNVGVKTLLEKHKIKYFSTNSDKKAAVAERFNRTLKTAMWKYFYMKGTYKWVDYIEKIIKQKKVKGKKMVLVKWLGYDSKHNSWIPESDIQDI